MSIHLPLCRPKTKNTPIKHRNNLSYITHIIAIEIHRKAGSQAAHKNNLNSMESKIFKQLPDLFQSDKQHHSEWTLS